VSLVAGKRSNPLHEIKDAFWFAIFFAENGFDDFRGLGFGKPALAKEGLPLLVRRQQSAPVPL